MTDGVASKQKKGGFKAYGQGDGGQDTVYGELKLSE